MEETVDSYVPLAMRIPSHENTNANMSLWTTQADREIDIFQCTPKQGKPTRILQERNSVFVTSISTTGPSDFIVSVAVAVLRNSPCVT